MTDPSPSRRNPSAPDARRPDGPGSTRADSGPGPAASGPLELSRDELLRYARHLALPDVGIEGQRRLSQARVLCVGAGGLGSPLAMYLAAAGVGTLGLVDFDEVDLTNLQRQILHGTDDVGRSKLESATETLRNVNPHVEVEHHPVRLTSENALDILADYDVVVDGTDNFPTRYLVNDACVLLDKPNVYGSVFRWEGQLSVFAVPGGPCYRCLFREPPPPGLVQDCAEGGVLGVLPGIIGSLQALETIKWILGSGDSMVGRLLIFGAMDMSWREVRVERNPDCPVCGEEPTQTDLIDYEVFCGLTRGPDGEPLAPAPDVPTVGASELAERLVGDRPPLVVDVREPWEWLVGNLSDREARHLPLGDLPQRLDELPRDRPLVLVCRMGGRSAHATRDLLEAGFEEVYNLEGGLKAWASEVDPELPVP